MDHRARRLPARILCASLLALLVACDDSTTAPEMLVRTAGGTEWIAIEVPELLPTADEWGERSGDGWTIPPDPVVFLESFSALSTWSERVRAEVPRGRFPVLDSAAVTVRSDIEIATAALQAGDSLSAARSLAHAAAAVHEFGPERVALGIIDAAEARLALARPDGLSAARTERLLRAARTAVEYGDSMRALQRALYALQLISGAGTAAPECPVDAALCPAP